MPIRISLHEVEVTAVERTTWVRQDGTVYYSAQFTFSDGGELTIYPPGDTMVNIPTATVRTVNCKNN